MLSWKVLYQKQEERERSARWALKTHHLQSKTFSLVTVEGPKEKCVIQRCLILAPVFLITKTLSGCS